MPKGVLFDVDGTLCDTNYLHSLAWARAFRETGTFVATSTIHHHMGMGSDKMVEALLGGDNSDAVEAHSKYYEEMTDDIVAFPHAADLLRAVDGMGIRVILATSASNDEYERLRKVLDVDDVLHEKTNGDEADATKPDPDIFEAALDKSSLTPADALVVGDTVWDIQAATKAGMKTIGVLSGGISEQQLREAGAIAVYRDVAHLLDELSSSPIAELAT